MTRSRDRAVLQRGATSLQNVALMYEHLEPTEDIVRLSRSCACRRHTLRGVPGSRLDVLVDVRLIDSIEYPTGEIPPAKDGSEVVEIGGWRLRIIVERVSKRGRYDGCTRDRIAFRLAPASTTGPLVSLDVDITAQGEAGGGQWVVDIDDYAGERTERWIGTYERLRDTLDGYDVRRIVMWHWQRYYQAPLDHEEASAIAYAFAPSPGAGLAEANREASRELYRAARERGWRKLTLRERKRLQLDAQWVDEVTYAFARGRVGLSSPTGAGEHSLRAARGEAPDR